MTVRPRLHSRRHTMDDLLIGFDKMRNEVRVRTGDPMRIGILASSGSGKTVLLQNLILMLAREMRDTVQFIGFDPKLTSLFSVEERFSVPVFTQPATWLPTMNKIEQIMNDRLAEMQSRHWTRIDPVRHGREFPQILVVVEELPSLINSSELSKQEQAGIKEWFGSYLRMARAANMGMIVCSQTFDSSTTIATSVRSQFNIRFIGRCSTGDANLFCEGQTDKCSVLRLTGPGEFFFAQDDWNQWVRFKTWYTDEEKIMTMARAYAVDNRDIGLGWRVRNPFED